MRACVWVSALQSSVGGCGGSIDGNCTERSYLGETLNEASKAESCSKLDSTFMRFTLRWQFFLSLVCPASMSQGLSVLNFDMVQLKV